MKKLFTSYLLLLLAVACCRAQGVNGDTRFSPQQLKADLAYLKRQIFDAHANPYTELSEARYEKLFDDINTQLTDSADATTFYKLVKPTVAYLSDEHAGISLPVKMQAGIYRDSAVFLPVSLTQSGKGYVVSALLSNTSGLHAGDIITKINNVAVAQLLPECALYTTGFKDQRNHKALQQFGYWYTWFNNKPAGNYAVTTASGKVVMVKGITIKPWQDFIIAKAGLAESYKEMISYTRYGDTGYIDTHSFNTISDAQFDSVARVIAHIFKQVKADGIRRLFVDVSKNGGGNSSVGDLLINNFYDKPYDGYQCNWKRSDEYVTKIRSWGIHDANYEAQKPGIIIHLESDKQLPTTNADRFNGKTYLIIGNGTFSSAIMFATLVKDNHIATLVGQVPENGHPNHFGEMYDTKLPNTGLELRFGVKEWIRPTGKTNDNVLHPDINIDLAKADTPQAIIKQVVN